MDDTTIVTAFIVTLLASLTPIWIWMGIMEDRISKLSEALRIKDQSHG